MASHSAEQTQVHRQYRQTQCLARREQAPSDKAMDKDSGVYQNGQGLRFRCECALVPVVEAVTKYCLVRTAGHAGRMEFMGPIPSFS